MPVPTDLTARDSASLKQISFGGGATAPDSMYEIRRSLPGLAINSVVATATKPSRIAAQAVICDFDGTLAVGTVEALHDGYLGRHHRALSEIVVEIAQKKGHKNLPQLQELYQSIGVIFDERAWNGSAAGEADATFRAQTGQVESEVCLGLMRLANDRLELNLSAAEITQYAGQIRERGIKLFKANFAAMMKDVHLAPGVRGFLERCRAQGIKIALCTSSPREIVLPILEHFKITEFFEPRLSVFEARKKVGGSEYSGAPVAGLCDWPGKLETPARSIFMIGDTATDLLSGILGGVGQIVLFSAEHVAAFAMQLDHSLGRLTVSQLNAGEVNVPESVTLHLTDSFDFINVTGAAPGLRAESSSVSLDS